MGFAVEDLAAGLDLPALDAAPSYLEVGLWASPLRRSRRLVLNPGLVLEGTRVSVPSRDTGVVHDYRLTARARELLETLGTRGQVGIPELLVERLQALDVLVPTGSRRPGIGLDTSRASYVDQGYARLPSLLKPTHLAWLRVRYRRAVREGALRRGDSQSDRRWVAHNEPAARLIHHRLTELVAAVIGRPVRPSYVYLASYEHGAELPVHTDRAQCEHSISLLVDYPPQLEGPSDWPLRLHTGRWPVAIHQELGEGLLYGGRRIAHSRPPLAAGHTSTSLFFHFVDADFTGVLE